MNRLDLLDYDHWQDSENLSRSHESTVMVLFVQRIIANLFCRWRVRKKTQSPWSLFRRSYGERFKKFRTPPCDWARTALLLLISLKFSDQSCVCVHSQAVSDRWAESSSPPGGSRTHNTVWTRHLVQSSFNSLPLGTYDGTFLFLTGSVVRPEDVFQSFNVVTCMQ